MISTEAELVNIAVRWKKPNAAGVIRGSYDFPMMDLISHINVDQRAGLPPGTTAILNHAFEKRLKRFQMWQMSADRNCREAFLYAASIFRRGVSAKYGEDDFVEDEQTGVYHIVEESLQVQLAAVRDDCFYVIDQNLLANFSELSNLKPAFVLNAKESEKTLETCAELIAGWRSTGKLPNWVVIGGGLTGDIGGFAAALTGSQFQLVPSTFLAMVDACVGGKTGVNYPPFGKNQIGRFAFPSSVTIDRRFLRTLSDRNFRSGIAESIKHVLLAGKIQLFDLLIKASAKMDRDMATRYLIDFVRFKTEIIEQDPDERGIRAILNFGHSFGHAIETASIERGADDDATILHGEAVAAGMVYELLVSRDCAGLSHIVTQDLAGKILSSGIVPRPEIFFKMTGIDPSSPDDAWQRILGHMFQDKKNTGGDQVIDMVLLREPGLPVPNGGRYTVPVPVSKLNSAFAEFMSLMNLQA